MGMIERYKIEGHLREILEGTDFFLVEVKVDRKNRIAVYLDRDQGISIDDCAGISRSLESRLDRTSEDFELTVSSPGLDTPFRVIEQYRKNVGNNVRVVMNDGHSMEGLLNQVDDKGITVNPDTLDPIELKFTEIKSTRRII